MLRKWQKPKPSRPPLSCDRKNGYTTYERAVAMAIDRVAEGKVGFLRVYECPNKQCGKWHLTSNRKGERDFKQKFPGFEGVVTDDQQS